MIEHCKQRSWNCEELARSVSDPDLKRTYLDLAAQWREMAGQLEAIEKLCRVVL